MRADRSGNTADGSLTHNSMIPASQRPPIRRDVDGADIADPGDVVVPDFQRRPFGELDFVVQQR